MAAIRNVAFILVVFVTQSYANAGKPIHVLVWDERQPAQSQAYDNFLGNEIVARLKASTNDMEFRSVALDDAEQGLSAGNLEWADVIIWWGHVRQGEITAETSQRVLNYIKQGDLDFIALHSAHWARPFMAAMNWRSIEDARKHFEKISPGAKLTITTVNPPLPQTTPTHGSTLTPFYLSYRTSNKAITGVIHLPWCCFPDYRPDGKPITVKLPLHPIAKGLPTQFDIAQTEMYNEPFHVPEPDEVIFEESWELGEHFRSGSVWQIEKGKVFYFRPGHEQYPVFKQAETIQILSNACRWLGSEHR